MAENSDSIKQGAEAAQETSIGDATVTAKAGNVWENSNASKVPAEEKISGKSESLHVSELSQMLVVDNKRQEDSENIIADLKAEVERLKAENATLQFQKSESEQNHLLKKVETEFLLLNVVQLLIQEKNSNLQCELQSQDAKFANLLKEIVEVQQEPSIEVISKRQKIANLEKRCEEIRRMVRGIESKYHTKFACLDAYLERLMKEAPVNEDLSNLFPNMNVNEHVAKLAEIVRGILEGLDSAKKQRIKSTDMRAQLAQAKAELWMVRRLLSRDEEGSESKGNILSTLGKITIWGGRKAN